MNDFLKTVYNRYEKIDFSYGQDNLNPIREMSPYATLDIDTLESEAYAAIRERIKSIKRHISETGLSILQEEGEKDENIIATAGASEGMLKGMSTQDIVNLNNSGSSGSLMFPLPHVPESNILDMAPLLDEIDKMLIPLVQGYPAFGKGAVSTGVTNNNLGITPSDSEKAGSSDKIDLSFLDDAPFGFVCPEDEATKGDDENGDGSDDGNGNGNGKGNGAGNGSDNNGKTSADTGADVKEGGNEDEDDDDSGDNKKGDTKSQLECIAAELEFLKILVTILKILQIYRSIVTYILGIILPIIELIQYAAGAWLNPSNYAMILQRLIQTGVAMLVAFISKTIQDLWDKINQDCLVQNALSTWDNANKAVLGSAKVLNDTKDAVSFTTSSVKKTARAVADAAKAVQGAAQRTKMMANAITDPDGEDAKAVYSEWNNAFGKDSALAKQCVSLFKTGGALNPKTLAANNMPPELTALASDTANALNSMSNALTKGFDWNPMSASSSEKSLGSLRNHTEY
jgi:hypothetical protein